MRCVRFQIGMIFAALERLKKYCSHSAKGVERAAFLIFGVPLRQGNGGQVVSARSQGLLNLLLRRSLAKNQKSSLRIGYSIFLTALLLHLTSGRGAEATLPTVFRGGTPWQWSERMAHSEMNRLDGKLAWKAGGGGGKWDYTAGLFTLSLLKLNQQIPDPTMVAFVTNAIGSFISGDGTIEGYRPAEYQLDALNPGKTVIAVYQLTGEERYAKAAALLAKQFATQPRTPDGGFWHKERYTNQMWLDGLYMGAPFYAEYTKVFGGPAGNYDEVARQFALVKEHLYDPKTGLYFHGWDARKVQPWANPMTGTSSNFWGRAVGWYAMALVDTLDYLPADHAARKPMVEQLRSLAQAVVTFQDGNSGVWWQVMNEGGRKGNYREATASTMFVYALAKGVNEGELSRDYIPAILKGYRGVLKEFVMTDGSGALSLGQCCQVAGLGFASAHGTPRDGSFGYYVGEPVVENDLKGIGPFILAGIEVEKLVGVRPTSNPVVR
jgi:unsaturated rhamnogalacturonyl hydrolase